MTRLFTFGCSFTNYRWSTWADCLAPEYNEFQNWGQSGAGNHFIFNSIMEADQRHTFGENDTVVVCWTNTMRDDRYINNKWVTLGSIANTPIYTKEFIVDHVDQRGYLIRDLAFIKAAKILLKNRPGVTWRFLSMCPILWYDMGKPSHNNTQTEDLASLYQNEIECILPDFYTILPRYNGTTILPPSIENDHHPTPDEHIQYLDTVLPGWLTKDKTRAIMHEETVNLRKRRSGLSTVPRL